jgi:ABC-2 type transport system permease protein
MMDKRNLRLKALIIKESFQIVRDPSAILISVVLPALLIFIYAFGVSLDLNHLRLGLVTEDTSPSATSLYRSFLDSRYFDVTLAQDKRELLLDLERGALRGIVVVPAYFSQFRYGGQEVAPIQVIADGSEPNTANFVQNYVSSAFQNWLEQEQVSSNQKGLPIINIQSRVWYNEQLESRYFLLPGSLAITMTLIGILLTALVVAREWERGTMEALMSTPVGIYELIIGKLIPYFILGILSMSICFVLTVFGFSIPFRGSLWLLALVTIAFLFCALALGLMISTLSKNQLVAFQVSVIAGFLPAYILSGFLFEISSMPLYIRWLTYFMPARYFVLCLQTLFLVGNVWKLIFLNILPMLGIGAIFTMITAFKTVKRLD